MDPTYFYQRLFFDNKNQMLIKKEKNEVAPKWWYTRFDFLISKKRKKTKNYCELHNFSLHPTS